MQNKQTSAHTHSHVRRKLRSYHTFFKSHCERDYHSNEYTYPFHKYLQPPLDFFSQRSIYLLNVKVALQMAQSLPSILPVSPLHPFRRSEGPHERRNYPPSHTLSSRHLVFLPLGTPQIFICLFAQNSSVCPYPFRTESV